MSRLLHQPSGRVKYTTCSGPANRAVRTFLVPRQSARLAEVMTALRDNWVLIWAFAYQTCKWDSLLQFIILIDILPLFVFISTRNNCASYFLPFGDLLPLLVQMPALFVVFSGVKKFTSIKIFKSAHATRKKL
jgi:hypothetical protein